MKQLALNNQRHTEKLSRSIDNKLFDLLIDLDQQNLNYKNSDINIAIKYLIIQKIFIDRQCIDILTENIDKTTNFSIEFGKADNNEIKITHLDKTVNIDKNNIIFQRLKDFIIRGNNNYNKIAKKYSFNYISIINYMKQCKYNINIKIENNKNNNNNLNKQNNINKFNNLNSQHVNSINSKYIKEYLANNNNLNNKFNKIENPYTNSQSNLIKNDLIGNVTRNHRDNDRERNNKKLLKLAIKESKKSYKEEKMKRFMEFLEKEKINEEKERQLYKEKLDKIIKENEEQSEEEYETPDDFNLAKFVNAQLFKNKNSNENNNNNHKIEDFNNKNIIHNINDISNYENESNKKLYTNNPDEFKTINPELKNSINLYDTPEY